MTDQEKLERINKQRESMGQEPLTELPGGAKPQPAASSAPAPKEGQQPEQKPNDPPPATPVLELNDDLVRKYLEEKHGAKIESFDDLKPRQKELTEEEKEQHRQAREAKKLTYGIEKGLFKKEEYDDYVHASKSTADLVYNNYKEQALADDPELTEFDIQEEFQEKFGLNADKTSRKYKQGQKELDVLAEKLLHTKYSGIYKLDPEFSAYENEVNAETERKARIISKAPQYKQDVESVANDLRKITHIIKENDEDAEGFDADFEFSDEAINNAKKILLRADFSEAQIERGWSKDTLKDILETALIRNNLPKILTQSARKFANAKLQAMRKDRQGVIPTRDIHFTKQSEFNNSEADQKIAAHRASLGMPTEERAN